MQSFAEVFSLLPDSENPKHSEIAGVPCILHEDHRWLLPLVHFAQQKSLLPKPCTVAMFDRHHDALVPLQSAMDSIKALRSDSRTEGVAALCAEHLKKNDDDWLRAGMELGMFGDAVIFGVKDDFERDRLRSYTDHLNVRHGLEMVALPRTELAYQGHLSDLAYADELKPLWSILGWEIRRGSGFHFVRDRAKILLTIDLDCFAIDWSDYVFAWPTTVFKGEFLKRSDYSTTQGWTGQSFLQELAKKSGIVAICRETGCCGGPDEVESILKDLLHYVFEDNLRFD